MAVFTFPNSSDNMGKVYNSLKELNDDLKKQEVLIKQVDRYNQFVENFPEKISRMNRMIDKYDSMLEEIKNKQNELLSDYNEIELCKKALREFKELGIDVNSIREKTIALTEEQSVLRELHSSMYAENEQFKIMIRKLNEQKSFQKQLNKKLEHDKELKVLIDKSLEKITVSNGMVTISRGD